MEQGGESKKEEDGVSEKHFGGKMTQGLETDIISKARSEELSVEVIRDGAACNKCFIIGEDVAPVDSNSLTKTCPPLTSFLLLPLSRVAHHQNSIVFQLSSLVLADANSTLARGHLLF